MSFRVGTFNVRLGIADDGMHAWPYRRDLLADRIKEAEPDVLGVQEAYDFQMEFLANALPGHVALGVGREDGKRKGEYAGLFYRKSAFECLEFGTFWLSESPEVPNSMSWNTACTRICTWARLKSPAGELRIFNAHLDHASPEARLEGLRLILRRALAGRASTILMGDFNAEPDDDPIQEVLRAGFVDAMPGSKEGTWHDFTGQSDTRIDYVFFTPDLRVDSAKIDRHAGPDGIYPSDHFPIWVDLVRRAP